MEDESISSGQILRANPSNNATNFLENVTNLINAVKKVLPATSTAGASTARSAQKKRTSKDPTKPLGRKPYPRDENDKIIRPANKTTCQKKQTQSN